MKIEEARKLKYGQRVSCPADRGSPAFTGTVRTETELIAHAQVYTTNDVEFIWIEVQYPDRHKAVWPSNRLGGA